MNYTLEHSAHGLVTEVGEIVDTFKRCKYYGVELDVKNLVEEIGDVLWYVSLGYYALGEIIPELSPSLRPTVENNIKTLVRRASDIFYFNHEIYREDFDYLLSEVLGLCLHLEINIEECAEANINKLLKRYPDKFTQELAINRNKEHELSHITEEGKVKNG